MEDHIGMQDQNPPLPESPRVNLHIAPTCTPFSAHFGIKDMIIRLNRGSSGFHYFSLINSV